ncbi:MAG: hypothetical protein RLZZ511_3057 [Cyanobacteriota bacterium]|jgi:hypothetical protein
MKSDLQSQLDQVAQALDRQDYRSATQLLKELWQSSPEHPWVQIYRARLYEAASKFSEAETIYRNLLKDAINPKVALQARQGLQRIQTTEQAQRQEAIAASKAKATSNDPGILVLESIPMAARQAAAQHMAKVMQLDAYTARMQIPNRGWKLYRLGDLGELEYYAEQIRSGNLPVFAVSIPKIRQIPVFPVHSVQQIKGQGQVICENAAGQLGEMRFDWAEVMQRVDGALPIKEQVVNIDMLRDRPDGRNGKIETLDYVRVCDLHLPGRNCILRLNDQRYDYRDGVELGDDGNWDQLSTRRQWNMLMDLMQAAMPRQPLWNDFSPFSEWAMEFPALLQQLKPDLTVYGQDESLWPAAFHLYSALAYWRR